MRSWLVGLLALCVAPLLWGDARAQERETRIALIVANEAYASPNLGRLPGTQRDAELMRASLTRAHFDVTVLTDLNRQQMREAIREFGLRLSAAGANGVGFFYYSGHGVADRRRGQNYLIPIDAQISSVTDLPIWGLALEEELNAIRNDSTKATFVVIDACRNTPVAGSRSVGQGLVSVSAVTRTLIAFSTQPGATAADDNVYARSLAQALATPGADAVEVFQNVQTSVAHATGERQIPRFVSALIDPIIFTPPLLRPADQPAQEHAAPRAVELDQATRNQADDDAYSAANAANTIVAYNAYLRAYASGRHVGEARNQLAVLIYSPYDLAQLEPRVRAAVERARAAENLANAAAVRARSAAHQAQRRVQAPHDGLRVLQLGNGDRFEGEVRRGAVNGVGVYYFAVSPDASMNLLRYEGELADNVFQGYGVIVWRNGIRFGGRIRNGGPDGPGVQNFGDSRYEGEFANQRFNGFGVLWDNDGHVSRAGIWADEGLATPLTR